ncbi:MAG: sialidase family protein [Acidimicrobiales bacterium]
MRLASRRLIAVATVVGILGVALVAFGMQGSDASLDAGSHGLINDDRPGINAHNSPVAVADPKDPDVLAVADRIDTPNISCLVSLSGNRGVNWRGVDLPLPTGAANCYWPDVAFAPNGDLLVLTTAMGGRYTQPLGVWLQRLRQGVAVGAPVAVAGPNAFQATLALDGERVVVAYVQAQPEAADRPLGFPPGPNPLVVVTSADGGATFSAPVTISEAERRVAVPRLVTGPGGLVVMSALDLVDDALDYDASHEGQGGPPDPGHWRVVTWTSADGGARFGPPAVVNDAIAIPQRIYVDVGAPRPGLARDPRSGRLYVTWESGVGRARDAFLASSDDDGATWSPARPVATRPGTQSLPTVAVSPEGRVDVAFYDRSQDITDVRTEVALASSWDGGQSFTTSTISLRRFDTRIGIGSFQGIPVLGTHLAVVAGVGDSVVFWADTRRGTQDDNVQDIAVALVDVHGAGAVRRPLVLLGLLALVGAGALALRR